MATCRHKHFFAMLENTSISQIGLLVSQIHMYCDLVLVFILRVPSTVHCHELY